MPDGALLRRFPTPWARATDVQVGGDRALVTGWGAGGATLIDLRTGARWLEAQGFSDAGAHMPAGALSADGSLLVCHLAWRLPPGSPPASTRLPSVQAPGSCDLAARAEGSLLFVKHSHRDQRYAVVRLPLKQVV